MNALTGPHTAADVTERRLRRLERLSALMAARRYLSTAGEAFYRSSGIDLTRLDPTPTLGRFAPVFFGSLHVDEQSDEEHADGPDGVWYFASGRPRPGVHRTPAAPRRDAEASAGEAIHQRQQDRRVLDETGQWCFHCYDEKRRSGELLCETCKKYTQRNNRLPSDDLLERRRRRRTLKMSRSCTTGSEHDMEASAC